MQTKHLATKYELSKTLDSTALAKHHLITYPLENKL